MSIECSGGDPICVICAVGDDLEDPAVCQFDDQMTEDNTCPGFQCSEQCIQCPTECKYLYHPEVCSRCGGSAIDPDPFIEAGTIVIPTQVCRKCRGTGKEGTNHG